jgi:16S rRNA (guanine527-N7)-methyltransferase
MTTRGDGERYGKPKVISSEQNETFRSLQKLLTTRGIQDQGLALIAGDKIIPEVAAHHRSRITSWITTEGAEAPPQGVPWIVLAKRLFDELNQFGTRSPLVTVTLPPFPPWQDKSPWPKGCSLFLALQNPENIGGVVRSAAAFGVSRIVLLKESAHPFHPKAMRAAGTALLTASFERGPSIQDLSITGVPLLALDAGGTPLPSTVFPESFALLPGVEGPGIPDHVEGRQRISIPMKPGVESLNAATATAIALYEWQRGCSESP